jgi:hypothetical protein
MTLLKIDDKAPIPPPPVIPSPPVTPAPAESGEPAPEQIWGNRQVACWPD